MSDTNLPGRQPGLMVRWRAGVIREVVRRWAGCVELLVAVEPVVDGEPAPGAPGRETLIRALAFPALVGEPEPGDDVLITTGALERGLGTGGFALVAALPHRLPTPDYRNPSAGHLVKARYTPLQAMVLGADEQDSSHHDLLREADDLAGLPVVVADLHSALAPVVAGIRRVRPAARVAYVMTDGGALPAWFSRTVASLRDGGWLAGTVSVGQAFGGDVETVTLHTGLLAARLVLDADVAVVAQGPGNLGTGTRWGFSGVAAGEAINATVVLGGRPVASLRISQADPRERHRGVSHHSLTAYGRVALVSADVVVPLLEGAFGQLVRDQAATLGPPHAPHRVIELEVDGLLDTLRGLPMPLSTMGRGLDDDPAAFLASAVAGVHAGLLSAQPVRPAAPGKS